MMTNPARVLGTMHAGHGMYSATNLLVDGPTGVALADGLRDRLTFLQQAATTRGLTYEPEPASLEVAPEFLEEHAPIGTLPEDGAGSGVFQRLTETGWSDELEVPKTQREELRTLLQLRNQVRALLDMESAAISPAVSPREERERTI